MAERTVKAKELKGGERIKIPDDDKDGTVLYARDAELEEKKVVDLGIELDNGGIVNRKLAPDDDVTVIEPDDDC